MTAQDTIANEDENPRRKELGEKLIAIFIRLKLKGLSTEEIADRIDESYHKLAKYRNGNIPKHDMETPQAILTKLEILENSPIEYKLPSKKNSPLEEDGEFNLPANKTIQCIFLAMNMKPKPYYGKLKVTGIPIVQKGKDAILAYPNDPEEFPGAEGQLIIYDPAAEHLNGSKIAVARIQVEDCAWGSFYYIIDKSNQSFLRKIYKEENGEYRLEAINLDNHPKKMLPESKIRVVFRIIGFVIKSQPAILQNFLS